MDDSDGLELASLDHFDVGREQPRSGVSRRSVRATAGCAALLPPYACCSILSAMRWSSRHSRIARSFLPNNGRQDGLNLNSLDT
jgi:hypothetical protein